MPYIKYTGSKNMFHIDIFDGIIDLKSHMEKFGKI